MQTREQYSPSGEEVKRPKYSRKGQYSGGSREILKPRGNQSENEGSAGRINPAMTDAGKTWKPHVDTFLVGELAHRVTDKFRSILEPNVGEPEKAGEMIKALGRCVISVGSHAGRRPVEVLRDYRDYCEAAKKEQRSSRVGIRGASNDKRNTVMISRLSTYPRHDSGRGINQQRTLASVVVCACGYIDRNCAAFRGSGLGFLNRGENLCDRDFIAGRI